MARCDCCSASGAEFMCERCNSVLCADCMLEQDELYRDNINEEFVVGDPQLLSPEDTSEYNSVCIHCLIKIDGITVADNNVLAGSRG